MKLAKIKINTEYLQDILHMPKTAIIHNIELDKFNQNIEITVEDYALKDIEEGEKIPLITPIIHVIEWDWNQGDNNG